MTREKRGKRQASGKDFFAIVTVMRIGTASACVDGVTHYAHESSPSRRGEHSAFRTRAVTLI